VALSRARSGVGKLKDGNPDIQAGINIVFRALEAPVRQIVENTGVEGSVVVGMIDENKSETYGFDAADLTICLLSAGIVDPARRAAGRRVDRGPYDLDRDHGRGPPKKKEAPAMPPGGMTGNRTGAAAMRSRWGRTESQELGWLPTHELEYLCAAWHRIDEESRHAPRGSRSARCRQTRDRGSARRHGAGHRGDHINSLGLARRQTDR
jgi:hypothetical protein